MQTPHKTKGGWPLSSARCLYTYFCVSVCTQTHPGCSVLSYSFPFIPIPTRMIVSWERRSALQSHRTLSSISVPQLTQCTITETQTFPATLAPVLSYLTFEGDYCKELTWYVKEAAAREQVGHLLMPTSPLLFIWQHWKYFYSLLFFFFLAIFESLYLKSTFRSVVYADW